MALGKKKENCICKRGSQNPMWSARGTSGSWAAALSPLVPTSWLYLALCHLTWPGLPWSQVWNTETAANAPAVGSTPPEPL